MASGEPSDEELLLSGCAEDFGLLYERCHPPIRGYLRRRIGSQPDVVLDLVAETFARALERREQFDPERGSAIGWLLTIARHLLLDAARRGRVADESRRLSRDGRRSRRRCAARGDRARKPIRSRVPARGPPGRAAAGGRSTCVRRGAPYATDRDADRVLRAGDTVRRVLARPCPRFGEASRRTHDRSVSVPGRDVRRCRSQTEARRPSARKWRAWLSRRLNAAVLSLLLVLGGGAVAVAASGLLNGSPVGGAAGSPHLKRRDRRFHCGRRASAGALGGRSRRRPSPGGCGSCTPPEARSACRSAASRTASSVSWASTARSTTTAGSIHFRRTRSPTSPTGMPTSPVFYPEVMLGDAQPHRGPQCGMGCRTQTHPVGAPAAIGLMGAARTPRRERYLPHQHGPVRTSPVSPGTGAYMIVEPVRQVPRFRTIGGFQSGSITGHEVGIDPTGVGGPGAVSMIVYRSGSSACSVGAVQPGSKRCLTPPRTPISAYRPTRSLSEPVRVTAVVQSHALCSAAFLLDPCYKAEVEFKAPYAVTSARAANTPSAAKPICHNATPSSWSIDRDISRSETVRSMSLGYFNCLSDEFEVEYLTRPRGRRPLGHASNRSSSAPARA